MKGKKLFVPTGSKFGFLTILKEVERKRTGTRKASCRAFLCVCVCGKEKEIKLSPLTKGKTVSCGCYHPLYSHRMTKTPTYASWREMKRRCNCKNEERQCYKSYFKIGITYNPSWEKFENFLKDMGERPDGMTLDRKDPFGNYCKKNCRWATTYEQSTNRRDSKKFTFQGKKYNSFAELSKTFGIHPATIKQRLKNKWSLEKTLLTSPGKNGKKK
jgi:hypothetical protein